ncbi:unnamed protein product [Sphenostylis stenocarpa]|uniref:Uncharacterized protein n=1 Tax=Sphenostylis stenocarpa TaxID=92480 RepID=A0AA86VU56_9FABA|nr:unnamed protein product [Sphenostylis stenocarpa]
MSSTITSQVVVLATAMAVSGTVIYHALRLQRSFLATQFPVHEISQPSTPVLRSCISTAAGNKGEKKKKKRVHFADDVVDLCGDGEEFRRKQRVLRNSSCSRPESIFQKNCDGKSDVRGMSANRVALYNGILRDRVKNNDLLFL